MSNALTVISETLRAPETTGRLMLALGYNDPKDPQALNDAKRYAASVLAEVEKTAGDSKKDLTVCRPQSIVQAMVDAAQFRLMIDGRQLAHLVKYGSNATFMPGFRGYLFKIKEAYPDADFVVEPVYQGDELRIWEADGVQHYELKKNSVFNDGPDKFQGILFAVTYTDQGRLVRKVQAVPKARIDRARGAAKQDFIWKSDYIEKAKAAAIKAACKVMFASIQGLQEMLAYDNRKHYDIEKPIDDIRPGSIVDNLNKTLDPEIIDQEPAPAGQDEAQGDDVIEGEVLPQETPEAPPASNTAESEGVAQNVSHETIDEEEVKRIARNVRAAIRHETTEQGMKDLFEIDYFNDIEIIKKASKATYDFVIGERDKRLAEIRAGGQA